MIPEQRKRNLTIWVVVSHTPWVSARQFCASSHCHLALERLSSSHSHLILCKWWCHIWLPESERESAPRSHGHAARPTDRICNIGCASSKSSPLSANPHHLIANAAAAPPPTERETRTFHLFIISLHRLAPTAFLWMRFVLIGADFRTSSPAAAAPSQKSNASALDWLSSCNAKRAPDGNRLLRACGRCDFLFCLCEYFFNGSNLGPRLMLNALCCKHY